MKKIRAINEVFPEYGDAPGLEVVDFPWCDQPESPETCTRYYFITLNRRVLGTAFEVTAKGYGGMIELMVGVDHDLTVSGIKVIRHSETPGLGANITTDKFGSQFADLRPDATTWSLKKNGGDIDQISGATISSTAVMEAVHKGVDFFIEHRRAIMEKSISAGTESGVHVEQEQSTVLSEKRSLRLIGGQEYGA